VTPTSVPSISSFRGAAALLEVALLVEDAVVRQVHLAVHRLHRAVGEHRRGVVDVEVALGEAHDGDDALRVLGQAVERRARVAQEVLLEEQVLGRIADERALGEEHELRTRLARRADLRGDALGVAGDVAHHRVHLGHGDAQHGPMMPQRPLYEPPDPRPSQYSMNARSAGSAGSAVSRRRCHASATTPPPPEGRACTSTDWPASSSAASAGPAMRSARSRSGWRCADSR
jgi:hypothetical protein